MIDIEKTKSFREFQKLNKIERKLLPFTAIRYNFLYEAGVEPWIKPHIFISSGEWKRFLELN